MDGDLSQEEIDFYLTESDVPNNDKSDILSKDQVDDILDKISRGENSGIIERQKREYLGKIKIYDFKRPDKFSKDQLSTLAMIHETFARLTSIDLSTQFRTISTMRVASVDQFTYGEVIRSFPNPTSMALINMTPFNGKILMEVDPVLTFEMINKLCGGTDYNSIEVSRELTDIDTVIFESIFYKILVNIKRSWENKIDINPTLSTVECNPCVAEIVSPNEMVILITFETTIGETSGLINLCIPFEVVEPVFKKIYKENDILSVMSTTLDTKYIKKNPRLDNVFVNVEINVKSGDLSLQEYENLKLGSLIPIKLDNIILKSCDSTINNLSITDLNNNFVFDITNLKERVTTNSSISDLKNDLMSNIQNPTREESNLDKIVKPLKVEPFDFIKSIDPNQLLYLIQWEHPQVIALILSGLEESNSALILSMFSGELQSDVAYRIATIKEVNPDILIEIENVLKRKIVSIDRESFIGYGGVDYLAKILNCIGRTPLRNIIESLEEKDPDLAEEVKKRIVEI